MTDDLHKTSISERQVRELFVRTMRDSRGMDMTDACAFTGRIVGKSPLEVGLIVGFEIMSGVFDMGRNGGRTLSFRKAKGWTDPLRRCER